MIDKVILYKKQGSITDEVWSRKPGEIKDAPYSLQQWVGTLTSHIETDNKFTKIEVLSIEHRSNGGRTFKAYLYHNKGKYLIDLRDDALLEMIKLDTIKNGIITGDFSFISAGSSLKLVSTKGELYSNFIKSKEKKKKSKSLKAKDLIVGNTYETSRHGKLIYLGEFGVLDCMYTQYEIKKYSKKMVFIKDYFSHKSLIYCSSITATTNDVKIPLEKVKTILSNIYSGGSGVLVSNDLEQLDMIKDLIGTKSIIYRSATTPRSFFVYENSISIDQLLNQYTIPKIC